MTICVKNKKICTTLVTGKDIFSKVSLGIKDIPDTQEVSSDKCLSGYCPKNCVRSYKLGKKVVKMRNNVDDLLDRGTRFGNFGIALKLPPKPVDVMPCGETVGLDLMVDKVWKSIEDDNVGIIGLYGMGGAGKTTLMKRLNNEFGKREHGFDPVLWAVVSRDPDINNIMNDIRNRLQIDDDFWNRCGDQGQRAIMIYQHLKQKKFVLMLDDLWGKLELEMVGVPYPKDTNNKSKVLFTTRSEDVCAKMQAQKKHRVECLLEQEAFDLFRKKVGDETLKCDTEIPQLAVDMAKECDGLPLALITVGSAMAGVTSVEAWRLAKKDLMSYWTSSDLEDKVFRILKFSYDKLPDEALKSCFRYCALYPEDYVVEVEDLIDRWIGEGFLGKDDKSIYDMYEQGKSIVEKLKLSCLLEESAVDNPGFDRRDKIKMHDVIRDMALWLARDGNKNKDKVLVQGEAIAMSEMDSERLNVVERISIIDMDTSSERGWQVPACPNLITLCLWGDFPVIDYSNLQSMQRLKVLNLLTNSILAVQVPSEIGELINLEFLNLSGTELFSGLPIELKKLKNLRVFLMDNVRNGLESIPLEVIGSLERLKVFRFSEDVVDFPPSEQREEAFLEKLESLPKLEELCFQLTTTTGVRKLLRSTKLKGCSRKLSLDFRGTEDPLEMPSLASLSEMKQLSSISLAYTDNIIEGSFSSITNQCYLEKLRQVRIEGCNSITHLTWLRYAPLLEFLEVDACGSIEQVVKEAEDEEAGCDNDIFSNLRSLSLKDLPKLESIHKRALAFPSLKYIWVSRCPNLRKLPINSSSAAKDSLISIEGETYWWNNLEWEDMDPTTKHCWTKSQVHDFVVK